ncbi:hypothetical protein RFI_02802 [Reticulomyxa filosa]|uniref:ADP-ribosylation factor-like protein 2 n=1 Tax=Reticulomyxa filosa TaxID=46433 RepID=X6P7X9_RETFI|nr:hypothetical protein RFI_02802 [Reticulomyxa filosa]|eukprot:ETO34291.1 hypothetical protein RFI_02802 [Reticulomyxa filosa]
MRFNGEDITKIAPTLGFTIRTLEYSDYKLNIWDVGGQQTIRSYWKNYFEATDGVIWVIDSADKRRLALCKKELHSLLQEERLAGATLLILANKQDLSGALDVKDIVETLELKKLEKSRHYYVQACSAVTGKGLREGVDWLVKDIASRMFLLD